MVTEKTALFQELQEEDLYIKYKKLSRHLELLEIQESYIKDEQASLKRELIRAQEEVRRIQSVPLVIGQFLAPIDQHTGIVGPSIVNCSSRRRALLYTDIPMHSWTSCPQKQTALLRCLGQKRGQT